jgi:hypothetical protein
MIGKKFAGKNLRGCIYALLRHARVNYIYSAKWKVHL